MASGNFLYDAGSSDLMLCDHLEGWDDVGDKRKFQEGEDMCIPMPDSRLYRAETTIILQSN